MNLGLLTSDRIFTFVCLLLAVLFINSVAAGQCFSIGEWVNNAPPNEGNNWINLGVSGPEFCSPVRALVDGTFATHLYGSNSSGHLIEFFQASGQGPSWQRFDISAATGANIGSIPNPLRLTNTTADIQVFALSPEGHLLSFVTVNNTHSYQVFDLSAISGSQAQLDGMPFPIQFGNTVHVYATDDVDLHDFVKPPNPTQWTDFDLSAIYGMGAVDPAPFVYGGNSIQTTAVSTDNSDLLLFIESVNADGTLSGFPWAGDLTLLAGGTPDGSSLPAPFTLGNTQQNVSIWLVDTRGSLVDYFKAPNPANWREEGGTAGPGVGPFSPSLLYFPGSGTNGTAKIYTNSNIGHLVEFTADPVTGSIQLSADLTSLSGISIVSDPVAVLNIGTIEVFALH